MSMYAVIWFNTRDVRWNVDYAQSLDSARFRARLIAGRQENEGVRIAEVVMEVEPITSEETKQ